MDAQAADEDAALLADAPEESVEPEPEEPPAMPAPEPEPEDSETAAADTASPQSEPLPLVPDGDLPLPEDRPSADEPSADGPPAEGPIGETREQTGRPPEPPAAAPAEDEAVAPGLDALQAEVAQPEQRPLALQETTPSGEEAEHLMPLPMARSHGEWTAAAPSLVQEVDLKGRSDHYAGRSLEGRERETRLRGGSARTEAAVVAALEWLVAVQEADGRWSGRRHAAGRGGFIEGQVRGTTGIQADTGLTGLALLALLAHGETQHEGAYAEAVSRGLRFLQSNQRPSGDLGGEADIHARMYCHGMAMLALAEAYAMTNDPAVLQSLRSAIAYSIRCQDPHTGGWRYRPGEPGDTSQLGWQVMALTSASRAGVRDGDRCLAGARRFLDSVSSGSAGGLAAYRPGGAPTRSMTAEALVCRWCLGEVKTSVQDEASHFLMQQPPGTGGDNLYYWYYASLALCQLEDAQWGAWNRQLQRELLSKQRRDGTLAGSWDPRTRWGPCGGRVYTTAIGALCLEVYYRYAPQAPITASQPNPVAR